MAGRRDPPVASRRRWVRELVGPAPRVDCAGCSPTMAAVPWARQDSAFTRASEDLVVHDAIVGNEQAVANRFGVSWQAVNNMCVFESCTGGGGAATQVMRPFPGGTDRSCRPAGSPGAADERPFSRTGTATAARPRQANVVNCQWSTAPL